MGGGLAGIAAAVRLAERGVRVTLLETRKRLGGRATSHIDPRTGEKIDNCQHVLLGCCTNLIDLYRRMGVDDRIAWHRRLHFADKQGHRDVLEGDDLPAPLHTAESLWRFGCLSFTEKLAISRAMPAIIRLGRSGRDALDERTFADWLVEHRQPPGAVEKFWAVITISALNETPDRASAAYALQVFQEGFLAHRDAYVMGVSAVPLVDLYDPAERVVEAAGGEVRFGAAARELQHDGRRITGVQLASGETIAADRYVSAMPFDRLDRVIDDELRPADPRLRSLREFDVSPIIGIHLWYDRPVLRLPHLIFVDSPLQWVFNHGGEAGGQHLHGVISAAREWEDRPSDEIVEIARRELDRYLPATRSAELLRGRAIKEKRATFSVRPGLDRIRPGPTGAVENLLLAGDWCATGWPATMEGAVRSGYAAAGAMLGEDLRASDLPRCELYRLIARD